MMDHDFRPEVLAMYFPRLSLIDGVDTGKMLLQGSPLMYHYTIQEAAGVTLLRSSWPLNSTHLIIFCIQQITNVLVVWVAK